MSGTTYETLLVEQHDAVTLVRINRPQALNALNTQVLADLIAVTRTPTTPIPRSSAWC